MLARPAKIAAIRQCLAELDGVIEMTEEIMELKQKAHRQRVKLEEMYEDLEVTTDAVEKELLEYIAKNKPERLAELQAMLSGDDKSH